MNTSQQDKGLKVGAVSVEVVRGSLLDQDVDAVVNAANVHLADGGGITRVIFDAAGPGLAKEIAQRYPDGTPTATAVITRGHRLAQPWVIHVPGPDCRQRQRTDHRAKFLASYCSCLELADREGLESLAFCSISSGIYGCPLGACAGLAVKAVLVYLKENPQTSLKRVVFAMFMQDEYEAFARALTAQSATAGLTRVE